MGKMASPKYCYDDQYEIIKNAKGSSIVYFRVRSPDNKILWTTQRNIRNGCKPFNETQNREELEIVHPLYEKMFKKLGFNFTKDYYLGKKSELDYKLSHNKLSYNIGAEIKRSDKFHLSGSDQLSRYKQKASLKQHNMKYLLFSDPKGSHHKHGFISIKQLEDKLKDILDHG